MNDTVRAAGAHDDEVVEVRATRNDNWATKGLFILFLLAAVAYARSFLMPVVFGFLVALVFSPVRRWLSRRGVPDGVAAGGIVFGLFLFITGIVLTLAAPLSEWVDRAPLIMAEVERKVRGLLGVAQAVLEAGEKVEEVTQQGDSAPEVIVRDTGPLARAAFAAPTVLAQIAFVLVLTFFLLASGDMVYEKIVRVTPRFRDKRRAMRIAFDIERQLSRYLFTITLINAGLGVSIGVAMWALGMPNPALFAMVGFLFNFVPYIGALAGVAIATTVGLVTYDTAPPALLAGLTYFLLTTFEGQFVTPSFLGRQLKMNTVVIFLSVALWAWLWSIVGMLVAVPLLVTIRAFCEHVPSLEAVGEFIAARDEKIIARADRAAADAEES